MEEVKKSLLKSEIDSQVKTIENIFEKIRHRSAIIDKNSEILESLAYQLHNLYCAFEDLFKIVADYFENSVEDTARFHSELLKRMTMPIEGIRPALLNVEIYKMLDNLRAFRHFFRHAYSYELEPRKIKLVLEDAIEIEKSYKKLIADFLNKL